MDTDEETAPLELERRSFIRASTLPLLGIFPDWDLFDRPEDAMIAVDDVDDRDDYDADDFDAFLAIDTGGLYAPDESDGGWALVETTGENPVFEDLVATTFRTEKIGVSANQSGDLAVASATETRLAIDDTTDPYFDDFGELDADNNKIVLEHDSHHEIVAHAALQTAAATGQVLLRVYVNGTQRAGIGEGTTTTGKDMSATTSVYLKLDEGDEIYATVEHDTGSEETFPGDDGNYVSVIRQ